jgi:hypothetical protein
MTAARQAAPQNFGTLRLYSDPGVRDAPTWRRGRHTNLQHNLLKLLPLLFSCLFHPCFHPRVRTEFGRTMQQDASALSAIGMKDSFTVSANSLDT